MTDNIKINKQFISELWSISKPYWRSENKKTAWTLLILNIICVLCVVSAGVGYNYFYKFFYDSLQNFDRAAITYSLVYFVVIRVFLAISASATAYFRGLLSVRWRMWLSREYLDKWIKNNNHYHMQILYDKFDNPDQRISEDLEKLPDITLSLLFVSYQFLQYFLYIISFGYILWGLSTNFNFNIGGSEFAIPGFLLWVALIYSCIGSYIINVIGRKLSSLDYLKQKLNADFRFGLVRFKESSEQISFYSSEANEKKRFDSYLHRILNNTLNIISLDKWLSFFNKCYEYLSFVIGFAISIPFYLDKAFQLGTVMQISSAYGSVVGGFSIFVKSFTDIAELRSVVTRLTEFNIAIDKISELQDKKVDYKKHNQKVIKTVNLQLDLPNNKNLLSKINLEINLDKNEKILIIGRSGIGKSTFLRALSGIWPYGTGNIYMPNNVKVLFIPQKPYIPLGTFKEILSYPNEVHEDHELHKIVKLCGLEKFTLYLYSNQIRNWANELLLGEQQKISFARILLFKPSLIFLDEATSNLDENAELYFYQLLIDTLPKSTLISIGHRTSLRQFHNVIFDLGIYTERNLVFEAEFV